MSSPRNPARYCGPACRQAVRNVQDRERKWLVRGTLDGRKKRAIEALSYNGLVQSWPEITRLSREGGKPRTAQGGLFEENEE